MSKIEADSLKKISIWWLLKKMKGRSYNSGEILWGDQGSEGSISYTIFLGGYHPSFDLSYTTDDRMTGESKDIRYSIPIIETPCNFGGYRKWFECSLYKDGVRCGRRVGVLYKAGNYFACRHCYELTYSIRNENSGMRRGIFGAFKLGTKAERLEQEIKRKTWRGRPTRKYRRLLKMQAILDWQSNALAKSGELDLGE